MPSHIDRGQVEVLFSRTTLGRLGDATPVHWQIDGTTVFVDISGFTKLSERLARRGREGAEDITEAIDACFSPLLEISDRNGGTWLKFGGDAMLLFFQTDDHLLRACAAADEMRHELRTVGRIDLPGAKVNLRMSVGVHTGPLDLFLVGQSHHELIVAGPAATAVVNAESQAEAGQILLSPETVRAMSPRHVGRRVGERGLLRAMTDRLEPIVKAPVTLPPHEVLAAGVPLKMRRHIELGDLSPEHRMATVAFVQYSGVDELLAESGDAAADALHELICAVQAAIDPLDVAFLATDVAADGGKIILSAGVLSNTGNDEERMLIALRRLSKVDLRLPIRMGVNRGSVFAGPVGPSRRRSYTVMGDTVNLAARVMTKADAGEIVSTLALIDESDTTFELTPLEPFMVKGKAKPIDAVVVGPRAGSRSRATDVDSLPLVGRRDELAVLQSAMGEAVDGRGQLIEIVGEAGIGKSRIVEELMARATDVFMVGGSSEAYAASTPYFTWREMLRDCTHLSFDDWDETVLERIRSIVTRDAPDLEPWIPLLATPFDVDVAPTPEVEALAPEYRRPRTFEVVSRFLDVVLTGPTLITFDDAHWMDEASSALLEHLGNRIGERPWLCCVLRQDRGEGFVGRGDVECVTRLDFSPLEPSETRELARLASASTPVGPALLETVAERSGGNPHYLRDLVVAASTGDDESLPESIEAAAVARIDRLAAADRVIVRHAALLGVSFHPDLLQAVLPEGTTTPDEATWSRLESFLADDGDGYRRFRSEVVRDAAYEGLPYRVRRDLHSRVARRIEREAGTEANERAESLSLHYHLAGLADPAWRWSTFAGDRAVDHDAHYDAAKFYRRAIEVSRGLRPPEREVADVFEKLGEAYDRSGQFDLAHDAIDSARRRVGSSALDEARLLEHHALVSERAGRFLSAVRWARRGLRTLDQVADQEADRRRARLLASLATIRMRQRRLDDAERLARQAIVVAEASGERPALARACQTLEVALVESGRHADGHYPRRALALFEELGDLVGQSAVLNNMGGVAYWEGRWSEAVELYRRDTEVITKAGMVVDAAFGDFNVGEILIDQGQLEEGVERVQRAELVWRGTGDQHGVAFAMSLLARAMSRRGRYAEAWEAYEVAVATHRNLLADADARAARSEALDCLLGMGEPATALAGADELLGASHEVVSFVMPGLHRTRGLALAMLDRHDEAVLALRLSLEEARRLDSQFEVARALDGLATIGTADEEEVVEMRSERDSIYARLGVVRSVPLPPSLSSTSAISASGGRRAEASK